MSDDYLEENVLKNSRLTFKPFNNNAKKRARYHFLKGSEEICLTERQAQIASILLQEISYKEIANLLGITPRTVETHINMLRMKLRAQNKRALIQVIKQLKGGKLLENFSSMLGH